IAVPPLTNTVKMTLATILLATAQTILWASLYYIFPATLLEWEANHSWSRSDLTLAFTLAIGVSGVFSPLAGRFIDRGLGPYLLTVCGLGGGILMLMLGSVETLWGFYLIWLGIGVAMAGCLYEPCFAFLIRYRSQDAKKSITIITLVAGFASTICFPITHYVMNEFGLESAIKLAGVSTLVIACPMLLFSARYIQQHSSKMHLPSVRENKDTGNSQYLFLTKKLFWLLAISFSLLGITHGVVISHLLPILSEREVSSATAILIASLIGPMQVLGRLVSALTDKRTNLMTTTLFCFIGINVALTLFLIAGNHFWLLIGFVLFQGGSYGVISIMKPMVTREVMGQNNFGVISGTLALPYLLCSAFAPYLGTLIWLQGNYSTVLISMILISFISLLSFIWLIASIKKKSEMALKFQE
ncbi:MFS transporter, partial [Photobacterium sanctipauli]